MVFLQTKNKKTKLTDSSNFLTHEHTYTILNNRFYIYDYELQRNKSNCKYPSSQF